MVQKLLLVTIVGLLIGSASAQQGPSSEQLLGAIAGGALGNTIGDGDGRKAATVIGAIIGYRMGERVLNPHERREFVTLPQNDLRWYCNREVPHRYMHDRNLSEMWVRGCVQRLHNQQRELERQAYLDGLGR